jgi:hypothetical protein
MFDGFDTAIADKSQPARLRHQAQIEIGIAFFKETQAQTVGFENFVHKGAGWFLIRLLHQVAGRGKMPNPQSCIDDRAGK